MRPATDTIPRGFKHVPLRYGPYSASRLIVAKCPARFRSKYILRDSIVSDTLASARGSAIHEVLQQISEAHVKGEEIPGAQLNRWVEEAVGRHPASYEQIKLIKEAAVAYVGNKNPYLNETTRCEATLSVMLCEEESFIEEEIPTFAYVKVPISDDTSPYSRQLGSQVYFTAKLDQISLDHVNRIVTIVDHKSTPSANSNADHVFQMGLYAWIASLYYPTYFVRTVIHYAHPWLNFFAPPTYWNEEDLADVEEDLRSRVLAVENFFNYPALPGAHCDYCHMVQLCPENTRVREQFARGEINLNVNNQADMIRLANQLRVTGVLYDQLNKKLKDSIETLCPEGGVAIEGMQYCFKPGDEKVDWGATDRKIRETTRGSGENMSLDKVLKKYDIDPEAFKEYRGEKLSALFRLNKPGLVEELREYMVKTKSTRFGAYKI